MTILQAIIIIILNVLLRREEMDYSLCVALYTYVKGNGYFVLGRRVKRWRGKSKDSYRDFRLGLHSCLVGPLMVIF